MDFSIGNLGNENMDVSDDTKVNRKSTVFLFASFISTDIMPQTLREKLFYSLSEGKASIKEYE